MPDGANNCPMCGQPSYAPRASSAQQQNNQQSQPHYYHQPEPKQYTQQEWHPGQQPYHSQRHYGGQFTAPNTNMFGLIGFILALVSIFVVAIPVLNFIMIFAGLGLSVYGLVLASQNGWSRGFPIAGMIIAIVMLVIAIIYTSVMSMFSGFGSLLGGAMSLF